MSLFRPSTPSLPPPLPPPKNPVRPTYASLSMTNPFAAPFQNLNRNPAFYGNLPSGAPRFRQAGRPSLVEQRARRPL